MLGLYVHVPFCAQKCNYCDFNSYKIEEKNQKKDYLISIKKEMELYKEEFKNKEFTSVFLGGGTPSILTPEELTILMENIYSNFNIKRDAEITMECNPGTLNKVKLKAIKSLGINRLSMGLQVTQDHHLKYIGRIHTYEQFEKNYKDAIEVGIDNINVDLMYSLPNQSFDEWKETLNKIINFGNDNLMIPIGRDIKVLIIGKFLPIKAPISPYLLNQESLFSTSSSFIKKYFPYFFMNGFPPK